MGLMANSASRYRTRQPGLAELRLKLCELLGNRCRPKRMMSVKVNRIKLIYTLRRANKPILLKLSREWNTISRLGGIHLYMCNLMEILSPTARKCPSFAIPILFLLHRLEIPRLDRLCLWLCVPILRPPFVNLLLKITRFRLPSVSYNVHDISRVPSLWLRVSLPQLPVQMTTCYQNPP